MGFFDLFKENVTINPERKLINFIIDNSNELLGDKIHDRGHLFELLLLSSIRVINDFRKKNPSEFKDFQYRYLNEIGKYAVENGLHLRIEGKIENFMNERLVLYFNELAIAFDGGATIPTKLAYNLLEKPLETNPQDYLNLFAIITMTRNLGELLTKIHSNMNIVT